MAKAGPATDHWKSFAHFLAAAPPSASYRGEDLVARYVHNGHRRELATPTLEMFCEGECENVRYFDTDLDSSGLEGREVIQCFMSAKCRHCRRDRKTFALMGFREGDFWENTGVITKVGQFPPFGPYTPPRLLRLIQPDADMFQKGRRAESLGLGIGALTYYRRVVENQKDRLFDAIITAANKLGSPQQVIENLTLSKNQWRFSQAMDDVKDAIPDAFKINGHNPMALLHNALSEGVHNKSDEECLIHAQDARTILIALAERLVSLSQEQQQLADAVGRLTKKKSKV